MPEEFNESSTLWLIHQNIPQDIHAYKCTETNQLLQDAQELNCGILCTNVDWRNPRNRQGFLDLTTKVWQKSLLDTFMSGWGTNNEHKDKEYLPGDTLTLALNQWAAKVVKTGEDPRDLGWWSYMTLCGKHGCLLTIIMAYRVCKHNNQGLLMAACQPHQLLEAKDMENNHPI